MTKLLSIIVPSFNMERWLPACLDSISDWFRDGSPLEVIVVNDGSTDRTSEVAHAYAERCPSAVRVIDKANGHYGSAVNAGLAVARGLYVKALDADDTFDVDGLATLLRTIAVDVEAHAAPDLYLTNYDEVDADGRTRRAMSYLLPTDVPFGVAEIVAKTEEIAMHACTWRVALLQEMGYRQSEGITYSDVEWILYPMLRTKAIRYLPVRVYLYLIGREGQSVSLAGRRRNSHAWEVILARIFRTIRSDGAALDPGAREYLLRVATDMARMYLETAFVLTPVARAKAVLPRLAQDLESVERGLYLRLEREAMILKRSLRIHYLRVWRRLPVGKTLWMLMVRGYLVVTRWKR